MSRRRGNQNLKGELKGYKEVNVKFNVKAFALACGLLWGFGLLLITWWVIIFEGATGELMGIGRVYRGFDISPLGSVIGLLYGFVDGLIGGAIFAWLYNRIVGVNSNKAGVSE
jgi:hypothetical protein